MHAGAAGEYEHPYRLLVANIGDKTITNTGGLFARMVIATGEENAHSLFEIAESNYFKEGRENKFPSDYKDTFDVLDNRTGRRYELDIKNGAINATQLAKITSASGAVTRSFDPAYMNTVNCISKISYINGNAGILEYRGYPIEQLAEKSNIMEVAFLVIYGELPSKRQHKVFTERVNANCRFNPKLNTFISSFDHQAHPMGMLSTLIACLSAFYPEANPAYNGGKNIYKEQEERDVHIHRVLGCAPAIAAACFRQHVGKEII